MIFHELLHFEVQTHENPQSNNHLKSQLTISTVTRDTLDDADASNERLFLRGLSSQPRTGRVFMRGEREEGR